MVRICFKMTKNAATHRKIVVKIVNIQFCIATGPKNGQNIVEITENAAIRRKMVVKLAKT